MIVDLNIALNAIARAVNYPVGQPLTSPVVLEIQIVTGDIYVQHIILKCHCEGSCAFPELVCNILV